MNPIRLVTGALTLPAHAAAAVIGTSVGVATTGARTTARVVVRVVEQVSGTGSAPAAPWPAERTAPQPVEPVEPVEPVDTPVTPTVSTTRADVRADSPVDEVPAAVPARKAPAKRAPATKTAAKKTAAKKAARKAPSKQAAVLAPALGLSEDEVEAVTDDGPVTPSGIPAAGEGYNPDTTETDLHQPGTEPLMDPATVKAAVSESEMMRRAADPDKG